MNIKPLQDRILVERVPYNDKTASGLYIPDSAKEKPLMGKVLAAGKGRVTSEGKLIPMELKVGDKILFGKYAGVVVKGTEDILIMREEDALGIVED